ncbi:hypothetical protein EIP86_001326 [Pleurotus ostreatoroseus]|nr:hypothetical protein EIP86_001326 [Pleurotus ostreatoroseus]
MLELFDKIKANPGTYGMQVQAQQNVAVVVDKIKDMVNNFEVFLEAPLPLYYHTKQLNHHTVFDLIGWLFSVCGDTPAGATRSNFYYPLIALFSVFTRLAAGDGNDEPQMVEAAWFTQDVAGQPVTRVVIGANLDDNVGERRAEKDITRVARAQMMIDVGMMQADWIDESFVSAPTSSGGGGGGGGKRRALAQLFGHCAEALPFLYLES